MPAASPPLLPHIVPSRSAESYRNAPQSRFRSTTHGYLCFRISWRATRSRSPSALRLVIVSPMITTTHIAEPTPRAAISTCAAAVIGADHDLLTLHLRDPLVRGMVRLRSRSIAEIDARPRWTGESSLHSTARQRRHANPEETEDA